jgi:hypothetical protein
MKKIIRLTESELISLVKRVINEGKVTEKWSEKYKKTINCNNPKGFSQKAHCQGKKKDAKEETNLEEEIDDDLKESFSKQRKLTLEMFERFGKYN